ncbi:2-polyprenyl-6-methoxyphenol hydroxylase [Nocardia amikacinitolerans]|uniref:FAD-dependent oxidoreductase n=1 Tax=Nocardia amikacinitolerans TaxID=756689 RepID=UPI000832207B|nr:FAD-dependent oxidoreductase [Nocardia amikacinitolerans]MCP2315983.1 2-polyprenyl-6-methoxyphenol hydroxylase [Nocardia amikacinitolerans]
MKTKPNTETVDVLIVGAGPTGTALAIDLTRRGAAVRVIDKAANSFDGSRAKGVQPRSLEVLEDLGVLDDILAGGGIYPPLGIHAGPLTIPWHMMSRNETTSDVPYPNTWLIPQFRTDAALRAGLQRMGVAVETECEFVGFEQRPDAVLASVAGPGGVAEISARYLVGADGGGSMVRKAADIGFEGSTDEADRMVIVDAVVDGLSRDYWHVWPRPGGRFAGACPLPHSDRFQVMIRLNLGEEPALDEESLNARFRKQTGDKKLRLSDIGWKSVFRPNIRLAERYRSGRVFIAGDAAHVHPPAGAQGLNTGLQDAYNLGWKLGQVLAGAPEALLDTYEAERQPIAARVLGLATKKYDGFAKLDPSSIKRGDDERQLGLHYRAGPLVPSGAEQTTTLHVGDRAPDAKLLDANGGARRLFELFSGAHFTAIAYGRAAAEELAVLPWPTAGAGLKKIAVDAGEHPNADVVLADIADSFARTYGVSDSTLLLIRPDGYLSSIVTTDMGRTVSAQAAPMSPAVDIPAVPNS